MAPRTPNATSGINAARRRKLPVLRLLAAATIIAAIGVGVTVASSRRTAPAGVSVGVLQPVAGQVVRSPVQLSFAVEGSRLGRPQTGNDHLHVSIDGGPAQALYTIPSASVSLPAGEHHVSVSLGGPDHAPLGAEAQATFTVAR